MSEFVDRNIKNCQYIASAVAREGGRAYYVGGCVRDFLLGKNPKDTDIEIYVFNS